MKFAVDIHLVLATSFILLIGLMIHLSLSPADINSHLVYICLGIVVAVIFAKTNVRLLRVFSWHIYFGMIFLLLLTLVLGTLTRGSRRWLDLGLFQFQTSEVAKLALIVLVADWIERYKLNKFASLVKITILASVPILLTFAQPDLGSAIILSLIVFTMFFVGGLDYRYILAGILIVGLASPVIWSQLHDYQRDRIATFLSPTTDPLGKGYNAIQSQIAVGSGQLLGRGLGHGTQSKLRFLPEYRTDFVFASLAEELGLVGSLVLLAGFSYLVIRLVFLAIYSQESYVSLVLVGITAMLVSQTIINVGMNIGIMPITGITLPFISAGGTSLVVSIAAIGIATGLLAKRKLSPGIEISVKDK